VFSRRLQNQSCVRSVGCRAQTKHVGNELSTQKMFVKTSPLQHCNDDQKRWHVYWWGKQGGKNHGFRRHSEVQATFLPIGRRQPPQTCRKRVFRCFTPSHHISCQNFYRKFLLEHKSTISTRWLITFQALFLAITCQTARLVAFPRSLWLQFSFLNILRPSTPH